MGILNETVWNAGATNGTDVAKLDQATFEELRDIIYRESGIFIQEKKIYLLESRLGRRLRALNLNSFGEYLNYLKNGGYSQEIVPLLDAITINETSFFRNMPQLTAFEDNVLPTIMQQARSEKRNRIHILSAGCSSGEEPYTLAMILDQKQKSGALPIPFSIVGIDISTEMLQNAQRGEYSKFSIRNVPDFYLNTYFVQNGNRYILDDRIRHMVKFYRMNLMDSDQLQKLGRFDVIFCRNVLIYFDRTSKVKTIQLFYDMLYPKGYLFLGHSESLHGISQAFKLILFKKALAYQKT